MSEIATLLGQDAADAHEARKWMDQFHPSMFAALNEAAVLYEFASNAIVNSDEARTHERTIFAATLGLSRSWSELIERIVDRDADPRVQLLSQHFIPMVRSRAASVAFLLVWRHFRWAATDLCRFRLTAALGYQRQQAEAVALFWLLREQPTLGERWASLQSDEDGRRFHRDTHRQLREIMRRHQLARIYERGSAASLHARLASASHGLRLIPGGVPTLVDAEVNPIDLYDYHRAVAEFLRTQQLVFRALDPANPERDLELPRLARRSFERHLEAAFAHFPIVYGDRSDDGLERANTNQ